MSIAIAKKQPLSFVAPVVGAAGAFAGLFVGTAQGSTLIGVVLGAVILAALAFVLVKFEEQERLARWTKSTCPGVA